MLRTLVLMSWAALCLGRADSMLNPYQGQPAAERAGAKLYRRYCASCHDHGSGPSLRSPAVAAASPGALFWLLRHGSLRHGMPSWSHLPDPQRWQLITYLKTLR